jgi:hypothetical protein
VNAGTGSSADNYFGWTAIIVAVLATVVILYLFLGGIFGAATDCAVALESSKCRLWMILVLGAPILMTGVWLVALGIFHKRGRVYWAVTAGVYLGYVAFCFFG